jgi:2,4-dienoyl-CoA reductase-like NADH-dependent reductase (Old Yellow Enzyme family)
MATDDGDVTDELIAPYSNLARGGFRLDHLRPHLRGAAGQYEPRQLGFDRNERIGPLARVIDAVRRYGGKIFAELSHAGSQ